MTSAIETGTERLPAELDDNGILRVVLNNPARYNSLTADMLVGLQRLFESAGTDDAVRAILVRGHGTGAFASGVDIGEQAQRAETRTRNPDRGDFLNRLQACPKPVVAMIHGYCIGGGLMLAMAADIRIASDEATFSVPPVRLGVAYPLSAVEALVELVGRAWASDLMLSGDRISAARAFEMGLVTRTASKADLETVTEDLLATMAANAPLSMGVSKASIAHVAATLRTPIGDLDQQIDEVWASEDAREGMTAFFDKRPPSFRGR